ncbi:DUF192 domain-containing protein [Denitratimonas sp. CY0512]|uniref:DUF192 domain-containing protein n=1 Tax=Denitratimonas sp. CY0512 TaxID=3131940 RepID=UPI00309B4F6A
MDRELRSMLLPVALLLAITLLCGCATAQGPWVELKGQRYQVELALDDASRMRGLMFRDSLPQDHGMLFVFEQQEPQAFWMRNTRIPLDILYFDDGLRLVSATHGAPPCTTATCPSYPSTRPARFVLELNAGHARRLGVVAGDELVLAPRLRARLDPPPRDTTSGT